jgi:hypothetical protein
MAGWGFTQPLEADAELLEGIGIDGCQANFPRGTRIVGNMCREIGTQEKQSSCWFQAKTAESNVSSNVFFNGPRALINLNDNMGGGNTHQ